jgi:hypothetical protein
LLTVWLLAVGWSVGGLVGGAGLFGLGLVGVRLVARLLGGLV